MSIYSSLLIALSGLGLSQSKIREASDNIANAYTPGRTKHEITQKSIVLGRRGAGVALDKIIRRTDGVLTKYLRNETPKLGEYEALDYYFNRTQDLFGQPGSADSLNQFFSRFQRSLHELTGQPASVAARGTVVQFATALTKKINDISNQIQTLRQMADKEIKHEVDEVNQIVHQIRSLNNKLGKNVVLGDSAPGLEDQRDLLVGKLMEKINVQLMEKPDGSICIYTSNGNVLLQEKVSNLSYTPATLISPNNSYPGNGIGPISLNGIDLTTTIESGKIKGLIDMRDKILPQLQQQLDVLASQFRDSFNEIHNQGTQLSTSLTSTRTFNAGTDVITTGTMQGHLRIGFVNAQGDFVGGAAHDIDLSALGAGPTVNALIAAINTACGAGTANLVNGKLVLTPAAGQDPATKIAIGGIDGNYAIVEGTKNFSQFFGFNDFFTSIPSATANGPVVINGVANTLNIRTDILSNPSLLSVGKMLNNGNAAFNQGDDFVISKLRDLLLNANTTFQSTANYPQAGIDGIPQRQCSFSQYGADIIEYNSDKASITSSNASIQRTRVDQIADKLSEITGVSIEEEIQQLLTLQAAYNASSYVIRVSKELLDSLEKV